MTHSVKFTWLFMITLLMGMLPEMAMAADYIGNTVCAVVELFTSQAGKGIATLAIVFLGIGAFFGKVNWGLALMVAVGIIAIFGAANIADYIAEEGSDNTAGGGFEDC